ncbi:tetratricopeptide repeat protein, partial [Jatrophihabitans endophyticus]|uniref:tetratricopeptide repeat protein n=1 Tax=Jatrophihabitans endophyticus TaxID=1206085 RepID=UPI0019FE2569
GVLHSTGTGVPKDLAAAIAWYEAAAQMGHPVAQFNLAALVMTGRGTERDVGRALFWYEKAAERNFSEAQVALAQIHGAGRDVPRDLDLARHWCERASRTGNPTAVQLLKAIDEQIRAAEPALMHRSG